MRDEKEPPAGGQGGADDSAYGEPIDKSMLPPEGFKVKGITPSAVWCYTNADGDPLYATARFERGTLNAKRKVFKQYRWEGGRYLPGLAGGTPPLYGLHLLDGTGPVLFVEGEKNADALRGLGYTATTTPGGTGNLDAWLKARGSDLRDFEGRTCFVLPDNDTPGAKHARTLTEALRAAGADVRLVDVAGWAHLGDAADVADLIAEGAGRAEVDALLEAAPTLEVSTPAEPAASDAQASDLPPVPFHAFPPAVADYIRAVADNRCVDPAMPATFALGVAAAAVGRAAEIELRPDWREYAVLWLGHVAAPGKLKSPTLKTMSAPLYAYDDQLDTLHAANLAQWEAECEIAQAKKAQPPERPRRAQAVVGDVTIEALADVLEISPRVAGIYDELGAMFDAMGAYKKSGGHDRQAWLSVHACTRLVVNRKGKDPLIVPDPRLTIIGATTPATAARVLGTLNGDGMVDRFFLTRSEPCTNRFRTPPVPVVLRTAYEASIKALCALGTSTPRVLTLTREAADVFADFYESLDPAAVPVSFQGVVGKLAGHVGRIALTLALWHNPAAIDVSGDVMRGAVAIGEWLRQHTADVRSAQHLSARDMVAQGFTGTPEARKVLTFLRKPDNRARHVPLRDIAGGVNWGKLDRTIETARTFAAELVDLGFAAWVDPNTVALAERGRDAA
jgi:hypothetical protein